MLDPEVELRIDGGVLRAEASLVLHGAEAVAAHTATYSKLYPFVRPALVNGAAGAVVAPRGRVFSVMAFTVTNGKIVQIDALLEPKRLEQLDLTFPPDGGSTPLSKRPFCPERVAAAPAGRLDWAVCRFTGWTTWGLSSTPYQRRSRSLTSSASSSKAKLLSKETGQSASLD